VLTSISRAATFFAAWTAVRSPSTTMRALAPSTSTDAGAVATRAIPDGDHVVLDGIKLFTTGALNADYILTVARTSPDHKASRGSSIFLVRADSPGLRIDPLPKIASTSHATCQVRYQSVRLPREALLGQWDLAWPLLIHGSAVERLCMGCEVVSRR
jgi:alkylation response protein AidB-like acyl-CoA dehydrogenase